MFGAIEAGGTKFVCGVGTGPEDLKVEHIATTTPDRTMGEVIAFFERQGAIEALGIGCFGPIDRVRGQITSTPKLAWQNYEIVAAIRAALNVPVAFDTDVNAAAVGEARWGSGRGLTDFLYLTIGTGIGGGAFVNGGVLHGTAHAEMGHVRIPHDRIRDPFPGCCPYHGDCLEGLASGPAIEARWDRKPESLAAEHPVWALEAHYLAEGVANLTCAFAPQRIVMGGGIMRQPHLLDLVASELRKLLNGYVPAPELVRPGLGERSGVLGALAMAQEAAITNR